MTIQPLIVDCYEGDGVKPADVATLVAAGAPWFGLILQASNGLTPSAWFHSMWFYARNSAGPRYGVDWFRGAYHYLRVDEDPTAQADVLLDAVLRAGGWDDGDFWPAVDIERGEQPAGTTAAKVQSAVTTFADRVLARTGKRPLLYAGSYTRDLGITSRMGCALLWFPEWSAQLDASLYQRMGWTLPTTLLWQYCGDGNAQLAGYPHTTPIGKLDISVMIRANLAASVGLEWTRTHTGAQPV